jgi:hypothetical protein
MIRNIFFQENIQNFIHACWVQITINSVGFFKKSSVSLLKVRVAIVIGDKLITFFVVIIPGLLNQY